ncbi:MAG: glycosyltransferase family 4 protein [Candidatus Bathyarchaeia archaeon]
MESLKILLFNWRCWLNPNMGGAEVFTREVLSRWAKSGHDVTLFTSKFDGCKSDEVIDGVRIIRRGGWLSVYWKARSFYSKYFRTERFDVVIDEINTIPFLTPKFINNGERVFALIHQLAREYWFYETPFPISYIGYYVLEYRWLRNYVNIPTVTVSESTKHDLLNLGFKKVFVVPEGLNFEPLNHVPQKHIHPVIAYVGRLKKAKRPDYAVKAFKIVKEKVPYAELWIIGDGYLAKELKKQMVKGVKFFGNLPSVARRELIKKCWVLVNPSVREGFGLNVIEANALGTPCVAFDVAGLRDAIINYETGLIVKSENIRDLAEGIIKVLTDDEFRIKLSHGALVYSRRFSWDKVADEFMKVIRSAYA